MFVTVSTVAQHKCVMHGVLVLAATLLTVWGTGARTLMSIEILVEAASIDRAARSTCAPTGGQASDCLLVSRSATARGLSWRERESAGGGAPCRRPGGHPAA
jgi:hypothetical protein